MACCIENHPRRIVHTLMFLKDTSTLGALKAFKRPFFCETPLNKRLK